MSTDFHNLGNIMILQTNCEKGINIKLTIVFQRIRGFLNGMRYINPRFTYLFYLLTSQASIWSDGISSDQFVVNLLLITLPSGRILKIVLYLLKLWYKNIMAYILDRHVYCNYSEDYRK